MNLETLDDIQRLIDSRIEESLTLEYKREVSSNKDIAKDISTFANTEGGYILYGIQAEDKVPTAIVWIIGVGIEERIQNVIMTAIQPTVKGVRIHRISNPKKDSEAIYIAEVSKSEEAPHMANNRYFRRRGSSSVPMDDVEVKTAIFSSGRTAALRFEISHNLELIKETKQLIDRVMVLSPQNRQGIALIPFQVDAWNSVVASGLLSALRPELAEKLVEAYRLIRIVNSLMEWLKIEREPIVHTPIDLHSSRSGTYVPSLINLSVCELLAPVQS